MTDPTPLIPDEPVEVETIYTVFMFCYPWIPRVGEPEERHALRFPRPTHVDQSTRAYGNATFAEAFGAGVDVMVGFRVVDTDGGQPPVYEHFKSSIADIDGSRTDLPKIALSLETRAPSHANSLAFITEMREQAKLRRYFTFIDNAGRVRVPFFFWGIDAVASETFTNQTGALLDALRPGIIRFDGQRVKPYLVWEGNLVGHWHHTKDWSLTHKALIKSKVFAKLHGFYQHGVAIPEISYTVPEPPNWKVFPHYSLIDRHPSGRTITGETVAQIDSHTSLINQHSLRTDDGRPLQVIAGTMPQYARERKTYAELAARGITPKVIKQARVTCEDPAHLGALFRAVRNRGSIIRRVATAPGKVREDRFISLTSWAEWAEGSCFEPAGSGIAGYDPSVYGILDTTGQFLAQIRLNLRRTVRIVGGTSAAKEDADE